MQKRFRKKTLDYHVKKFLDAASKEKPLVLHGKFWYLSLKVSSFAYMEDGIFGSRYNLVITLTPVYKGNINETEPATHVTHYTDILELTINVRIKLTECLKWNKEQTSIQEKRLMSGRSSRRC